MKNNRLVGILLSLLLITQLFISIIPINTASAAAPKSQKITRIVESEPSGWDGIVGWFQEDDGKFKAVFPDGTSPRVDNGGSVNQPFPVNYRKSFSFTGISSWSAATWNDEFTASQLATIKIKTAVWGNGGDVLKHGDPIVVSDKEVRVDVTSGGKIPSEYYNRYGTSGLTGNPKYEAGYLVPLRLVWQGEVYEEKEIDVNPDSTMQAGTTKQLNASVRTKDYGQSNWRSYSSVASSSSTTWIPDDPTIATVSSTGVVTAKKAGTTNIRATWKSGTYEISDIAKITVSDAPVIDPCLTNPAALGCPGYIPPTYSITGDFDVIPNSIEYRENFALKAKNFVIPAACTYVNHRYTINRDGDFSFSDYMTNRTATTSYTYSTYPSIIGVGSHEVTMRITATCGGQTIESGAIGPKTLNVSGPTNNSAPVFSAGFFKENDYASFDPPTSVVINSRVNLRIINDLRNNPPTPYDPDGDPITYTWDFASSTSTWIKSLKDEYGLWEHDERHTWLTTGVLGTHCVKVTARDPYGASSTRNACINVVPANPVPMINAPNDVVEGRPLAFPIDGSQSYSPVSGRTISQFIWTNKLTAYMTPGIETIQLEVVDNTGLRSLGPASRNLTVKPDLPPVPELEYVNVGLRNKPMSFKDTSYSPDNDVIVEHTNKIVCDKNNNGSFTDDIATNMTRNASGSFTFTSSAVGNCNVVIYLEEDWGKTAQKSFAFTIVNEAPEADFSALGVNPEPPIITTITPGMSTLMTSAAWTSSSLARNNVPKDYYLDTTNQTLETRKMSHYQPYKSISANNVVQTEQTIYRSYCGTCGNTGTTSGYYYDFSSNIRLDQRFWGNNFYGFYDEDRTVSAFYGNTPIISQMRLKGSGTPVFNLQTGLIWTRENPLWYTNQVHTWTDYMYRINDLKQYVPGSENYEGIVLVSPYRTSYAMASSAPSYTLPSQVPQPQPPSDFIFPTPVIEGAVMEVLNYNINGVATASSTVNSNFNKDALGNVYKNKCRVTDSYLSYKQCSIVKYSPTGSVLWEYTATTNSNIIPAIAYISPDSSKLIIRDVQKILHKSYTILNSSNGSEILHLTAPFDPNSTWNGNQIYNSFQKDASGTYFLGVYDNVVAYINKTADANYMRAVGGKAYWELRFYNMTTGQTTSAGNIKTYVGKTRSYYGIDSDYYYINAFPVSVVSSDGKLIIANFYSNVLIYDMKTLVKEGDISTGTDPESYYGDYEDNGSDTEYSNVHWVKGVTLTEDGRLKIVYRQYSRNTSTGNTGGSSSNDESYRERALTIQTTPSSSNSFSYGYLSGSDILYNGDIYLKLKFSKDTFSNDLTAGIGFRSQNHNNMYRAEMSTGAVRLVKIVNGVSTVLGSSIYNADVGTVYDMRVKARGAHLILYINGIPLIDVNDATFASGPYGIYAEVPYVVMKGFSAALYEPSGTNVENQSIVNMPITYTKTYSDPESDPLIASKTSWAFTNTKPHKFLNVGDGTSDPAGTNSYNGVVVQSPSPALTKVGIYKVDLVETDDPAPLGYKHPSAAFTSFQKTSDPASNLILVHRRPIGNFTLAISSTGVVLWTDKSYDPDRWLSATNYSTENTGINYLTTRGILGERYSFTDPNGATFNTKLVTPSIPGVYSVRKTVQDEYGAWSDWYEVDIEIIEIPTNTPPVAAITYPSGTQANPTMVNVLRPTITWNQTDPDPVTVFTKFHVQVINEANNQVYLDTGELAQNRTQTTHSYTPTTNLPAGQKLKVRVKVYDGELWSEWSTYKWLYINRAPIANFDSTPKPAWEGDTLSLINMSTDPDGDALTYLWTITRPNGTSYTSTVVNPTILSVAGTYTVTLSVSDGLAQSTMNRTIRAEPLVLEANVNHTAQWLAHHEQRGHETVVNPKSFYTGEIFVVSAVGSLADTNRVTASLHAIGRDGRPIDILVELTVAGQANHFTANLYNPILSSLTGGLPEGQHQIEFSIEYTNGVVKEVSIPVQIIGHVQGAVNVHRRQ